MGNLLLTVYKELQKNNPFAHEYMEVVLEQIQVEKRLSKQGNIVSINLFKVTSNFCK